MWEKKLEDAHIKTDTDLLKLTNQDFNRMKLPAALKGRLRKFRLESAADAAIAQPSMPLHYQRAPIQAPSAPSATPALWSSFASSFALPTEQQQQQQEFQA